MKRLLSCAIFCIWSVFMIVIPAVALPQIAGTAYVKKISKKVVTTIEPLSVGDKVPDLVFKNVLNYVSNSIINKTGQKD